MKKKKFVFRFSAYMIFIFKICILLTQLNKAKMIQGGGGKIISGKKKHDQLGD